MDKDFVINYKPVLIKIEYPTLITSAGGKSFEDLLNEDFNEHLNRSAQDVFKREWNGEFLGKADVIPEIQQEKQNHDLVELHNTVKFLKFIFKSKEA